MHNTLIRVWFAALLFVSLPVTAQTTDSEAPPPPPSIADLTAAADLVLVAQVRDTDYFYTREFPSVGTAYLKPLITYKLGRPVADIIEVFDEGLHPGECYFDNPSVFEEGRRFLLFLTNDTEDPERYRGLAPGCAFEVLVTEDNSYALRVPATGIGVSDPLADLATEMAFADSYALVADEDLQPELRDQWLADGFLKKTGEQFEYTHGIALGDIRQLMGPEGHSIDRTLKR
jgi:hypothetical protein